MTFLSELRSNLQVSQEAGMRYNIPLMNALVLYVGVQAITHIRSKALTPNMTTIAHSAHMDIFQNLAVDLDTEGTQFLYNIQNLCQCVYIFSWQLKNTSEAGQLLQFSIIVGVGAASHL